MYLFGLSIYDNFIIVFVAAVCLLAFDFWTVKNITGRLLVGLRWWNEVKDDGSEQWIFESKPADRRVHPADSFVFWTALYITPLLWLLLAVVAVLTLSFRKLLIVIVALTLSGANLIGYWKCEKDAKAKLTGFAGRIIADRLYRNATGDAAQ